MGFHPYSYASYGYGWGYNPWGWPYFGYVPYGTVLGYGIGQQTWNGPLPSYGSNSGGSWDPENVPNIPIATPTPEPDTTPTPKLPDADVIMACRYKDSEGTHLTVMVRGKKGDGCPTPESPSRDLNYPAETTFCVYQEAHDGDEQGQEMTLPVAAHACTQASPPTPTPRDAIAEDNGDDDQ